MTLSEYVVYGEATVALFFIVKPCYYSGRSDPFYRQALVVSDRCVHVCMANDPTLNHLTICVYGEGCSVCTSVRLTCAIFVVLCTE